MKIKFFSSLLLTLFLSSQIFTQNYELVWSDEFDGSEINSSTWTHETGGHGWGNQELQYYTNRSDNSYVEDGKLVIVAKNESYSGKSYTSARMISMGKRFWKYGKVEASIRLPYGQGMWPAFWMMGENFKQVGWPACGEIDIVELIGGTGNDNTVHGAAHWSNNGQHASYAGSRKLSSGIFADAFHLFAIEWDEKKIVWKLDGIQYHVIDITPAQLSEFHNNFFLLLNLAVGGTWPGSPDNSTQFPQKMEVDFVRVYKDANKFPKSSILYPTNNQLFDYGKAIPVIISASDPDGNVAKVELFQMDGLLKTFTNTPYTYNWENVQSGCYELIAKVTDNEGNIRKSEPIEISVGAGCGQSPYLGFPLEIPGTIEAEYFDLGGAETAYFDTDSINTGNNYGNSFRTDEGVDTEGSSDSGFNVGWIDAGEWFEYTVNIINSGIYTLSTRTASPNDGNKFELFLNETNLTGEQILPNTGGWQNWTERISSAFQLPKGLHVICFSTSTGGFNLDKIAFSLLATGVEGERDFSYENKIEVYPNPFNGNVKVALTSNSLSDLNKEMIVYDVLGRKVFTKEIIIRLGANVYEWNPAESLNSGTYIIVINNDAFSFVKKILYIK